MAMLVTRVYMNMRSAFVLAWVRAFGALRSPRWQLELGGYPGSQPWVGLFGKSLFEIQRAVHRLRVLRKAQDMAGECFEFGSSPADLQQRFRYVPQKPWPMRCKRGLPMSWQMRMAKMWKWMMTVRVNRWHAIICHVTVDDATGLRWMQGRAGGARWKKQSFRASFIRRIVEPCFRLLLSSFLRGLKPGITRMYFSKNTTWSTFTTRWARSRWF